MKKNLWILLALLSLAVLAYSIFGGLLIAHQEKNLANEMAQMAQNYQMEGNIAEATSHMDYASFHGELANEFQSKGLLALLGAFVLGGASFAAKKKLS